MKKIILALLFTFLQMVGFSQMPRIDSLKHELEIAKDDTSRVKIMTNLCYDYGENPKAAQKYGEDAVNLAKKINYKKGEFNALNSLGLLFRILGDNPKSLELLFHALQMEDAEKYPNETAGTLTYIGSNYLELKDYSKAKTYNLKALEITRKYNAGTGVILTLNLESAYKYLNQTDSALFYLQQAKSQIDSTNDSPEGYIIYLRETAYFQFKQGNHSQALETARKGLAISQNAKGFRRAAQISSLISGFFKELNEPDSAIYYAKISLDASQKIGYKRVIIEASDILYKLYDSKDIMLAHAYLKIKDEAVNEVYGANKVIDLQKTIADEQERQRDIESQKIARENSLKLYALLAGLGVMLLIGFILYRNNQKEKKAKNQLQEKNQIIEQTLTNLKATQAQLIQSEKLASLGELTAGIAHEIQNPLNFVNNFSELSVDLVKDLKEEIEKPAQDKEYIGELFDDLSQNQEKISHHGKRASSIVKGMLEHSRTSSGVKELTDINKLADEYLRLSYHGLRAKDNSFNADFELIADPNLPKIEVIPQDIGRVLLNLINNAFYAVNQRKQLSEGFEPSESYTPSVSVTTQQFENQIIIKVKDNGTGMPESVRTKVFQPFFTTKPTGQGTGLGLSLAYDIVTKGHGGTLEVEVAENEGTTFIIQIPNQ